MTPQPVTARLVHQALPGRAGEVKALLDLLAEQLRQRAPGAAYTRTEAPARGGETEFTEEIVFPSVEAWEAWDDLAASHRHVAAVWVLLSEITDDRRGRFDVEGHR